LSNVGAGGDRSLTWPKSEYEKLVDSVEADEKILVQDPPAENQFSFRDKFKAAHERRFDVR